jgi:hypothetical protein
MAIFARRTIERELDLVRHNVVFNRDQLPAILGNLNGRNSRQAIATEWEVILLAELSRHARVDYEKPFGSKHPDLFVQFDSNLGDLVEFVADIVCVSDLHDEERNPIRYLWQEFHRVAWKVGVRSGGFDIQIRDQTLGTFPEKRRQLLLPPRDQIPSFLKQHVTPFLRRVRAYPTTPQSFESYIPGAGISIRYDPQRLDYNSGGHVCCSSPTALTGNVLYRSLNDKAKDLRESAYDGVKAIIVTDGGCRALTSQDRRGGTPWGRGEIIKEFLKRHPYIDFVTTTHYEYRLSDRRHTLNSNAYWQQPFNEHRITRIFPLLDDWLTSLPEVVKSPVNAHADIASRKQIRNCCAIGWYQYTPPSRLAFSCRAFVDLIAGTMTDAEFRNLFNDSMPNRGPFFDFFRRLSESKSQLREIQIIQKPDWDDDVVVFDLGHGVTRALPPSPLSCDIRVDILIEHFACLASEAITDQARFSIGGLPIPVQSLFRDRVHEGRLPIDAAIVDHGGFARFQFGPRDAAVSNFW